MTKQPILAAVGVAMLLGIGPVAAQDHPCSGPVVEQLLEFGIAATGLRSVQWTGWRAGRDGNGPVSRYEMWSLPRSCRSGNLVVEMTGTCHVVTVYTRGDCRIEGVDAW